PVAEDVDAVAVVEGVHLQRGDADEEARAPEPVRLAVLAQDVADVLAQEALDALAELLDPVGLLLGEGPVGPRAGPERGDLLVDLEVPGAGAGQVLDAGEGFQRRDGDGPSGGVVVDAVHAHRGGPAVDLAAARAAPARLAVPAAGQVRRMQGL